MTYFKSFPKVSYNFTIPSDPTPIIETIVDLTTRITMRISDSDLKLLCTDYLIQDFETPEKIAFKLYNNPLLHWTILYINGIANVAAEWPLTALALEGFISRKYGSANINNIHHYEKMPEMLRMDPDFVNAQIALGNFDSNSLLSVTNTEYEERNNEFNRFIKVIVPNRISEFVSLFDKSLVS